MSHYVMLHSHVSNNQQEHKNQIFNFVNEFHTPLECRGEWEVALVELVYPKFQRSETVYSLVYIDCVEFSYVGSHQYSVIRPVLLQNSNKDTVVNIDNYTNPYYMTVCKSRVESVTLQIEPELDFEKSPYSLNSGDVTAKLHFREKLRRNAKR